MGIAQRNGGRFKNQNRLAGPFTKPDCRQGPEWDRIRLLVMIRDNYTCQKCGGQDHPDRPTKIQLTVDHKLAVVQGGLTVMANLWTLCCDCHARKLGTVNKMGKNLLLGLQRKKTKRFGGA